MTMKTLDTDIAALNLECISYKACRDEGWSLEKIDRIEREYRVFLQMLRLKDLYGLDSVAPTRDIDKYWHHHILDTSKYQDDCQSLFGGYIHHFPYSGVFGKEDAARQSERVQKTVCFINEYLQ